MSCVPVDSWLNDESEKTDPRKKEQALQSKFKRLVFCLVLRKICMFSAPITFTNILKIRTVSFLTLVFKFFQGPRIIICILCELYFTWNWNSCGLLVRLPPVQPTPALTSSLFTGSALKVYSLSRLKLGKYTFRSRASVQSYSWPGFLRY